jgi:hypothetical protein
MTWKWTWKLFWLSTPILSPHKSGPPPWMTSPQQGPLSWEGGPQEGVHLEGGNGLGMLFQESDPFSFVRLWPKWPVPQWAQQGKWLKLLDVSLRGLFYQETNLFKDSIFL